jgi:hypothetical protein
MDGRKLLEGKTVEEGNHLIVDVIEKVERDLAFIRKKLDELYRGISNNAELLVKKINVPEPQKTLPTKPQIPVPPLSASALFNQEWTKDPSVFRNAFNLDPGVEKKMAWSIMTTTENKEKFKELLKSFQTK